MTPERYQRILQTLNARQPDLTVLADEVHKGRNLSAIVRTCDAVGIGEFHCVVPERGYRGYRGTASGSQKWVQTREHQALVPAIESFQSQGYQVVATHLSHSACSYLDVDYTQPTVLLMGSEKSGISDEGIALADRHVTIPMLGMVESLNVSVAAAIILMEARRQREQAGLYGECRLAPDVFKRRFFQWAHPQVTAYCDQNRLDYPEVCPDSGEIIDPSGWYASVRSSSESDAVQ